LAEKTFKSAEDLIKYYRKLAEMHDGRIRQHIELQHMWETPVRRNGEDTRTLYINNEPWTATRLTVALLNQGKLTFRGSAPPSSQDTRERDAAISEVERFFKAHYQQTDVSLFRRRRGSFRRQLGYHMAVYGWHAGINLVQDVSGDWPVFTDIWSPMDTFPDMDGGTALVHVTKMSKAEIEKTFGRKRGSGLKAVPGYAAKFEAAVEEDDQFAVFEFFDDETAAVAALINGEPVFLKRQMEHKLGGNPAWCNAVDAAPFRHATVDASGTLLTQPDAESNSWLETYGQSPMLGYKTAYRYMTELANQIADVVEKWAEGPIAYLETPDGRYVPFDIRGADISTVPAGTKLNVVEMPKFPQDDRAWLAFIQQDIEKASYPRVAYGTVGSTEAAYTLQLLRTASGYIIEPLVQQAELVYETSAISILRQLERRGRQYERRFFPVRTRDTKGAAIYDYVDVTTFPTGCYVAAELKGAGVPQDRFQALAAVTQAANAMNPVLSVETLLDEYLDCEDPPGEAAKMFWERMTTSRKVFEVASPIATGFDLVDRLRQRSLHPGDRAALIADAFEAQVRAGLEELKASIANPPMGAPGGGGGAPGGPPGLPQPPPNGVVAGPGAQVPGVAPNGAPPAGVAQPPTGPQPQISAAMQQAMPGQMAG
jgi:hypothetical protein